MPRLTRTCTALCSLVMALALFTLAIAARKYSQHLLSHHPLRHPQQQHQDQEQDHPQHHHRHEPTLAGALFPVADEILAGKDYVKEPCPTACVHHRSDVYLAVTSIGEGFPRVQFTCSHAHQSTGTAQQPESNPYQHPYGQGSNIDVNKQEPADPIPEHTPHASAQGCDKCNHHEAHDRTDGASIYTDLHITANPHLRGSPINNNNNNNAAGFQPYYDFIASPRERQSVDLDNDAETHTTTMTFSDDNSYSNDNNYRHHDTTRSVPLTSDQESHNRVHILPVRDRYDHHAVPSGSFCKAAGGSGATTPEPIATLAVPTSLGSGLRQGQGHGWGGDRMALREEDPASARSALRGHQYKAGPAAPTPEPFPAQTKGRTHNDYHHHQEQDDFSISGGKERVGQGHGLDQGKNPAVRHRTIVHRVTTLIIETETIVNRLMPTATASVALMQGSKETQHDHNNNNNNNNNNKKEDSHHYHLHDRRDPHFYGPHAGDHIIFDAGVDGDMVVSIASSEKQSSRNKAPVH